jgi:ADP-heptose:LPS heptosyltransferase
MSRHPPDRILVIKLGALGDFVLALAAMKHIRQAHPTAQISLLTTPPFEGLARASGYFNAIEIDGRPEDLADWVGLIGRLRKAKYDRVYDLQTSAKSSFYFQLLRPFPPDWSGIALGCSLPHRNRRRNHMHTLERQADQLKDAGVWPDAPTEPGAAPPPDLSWILHKAAYDRRAEGGGRKPYALLAPGGSAHRPLKRWPVERFAELAGRLRSRGLDIVIIGGMQESDMARTIQRRAPQARDLTGRTDFAQVAVLGARAAVAVGNDTGPLHLIAAAGAPSVALFSHDSDPALCAPRGRVSVLRRPSLEQLTVDQVQAAAEALLAQAAIRP